MKPLEISINRLKSHFHKVTVAQPLKNVMASLQRKLPDIPDDLRLFYTTCDGIKVKLDDEVEGEIFSAKQLLEFYPIAIDVNIVSHFLPIREDGCGDYDCLVAGSGVGANSVIFWDHEVYEGPAYLLGSSLFSYLDMWSDYLVHCYLPDGRKNPKYDSPSLKQWPWIGEAEEKHPWPFDENWMMERDPRSKQLLSSPEVRAWLLGQD
jgi:hypothetical protein